MKGKYIFAVLCLSGIVGTTSAQKKTAAMDTLRLTKHTVKPITTSIYTADPSAHVFDGKLYIYPSHDIDTEKPSANGDHFDMMDYHVLSMEKINGQAEDHGVALSLKDVPWATRQLWAPDAAYKNGVYYLYFPAKDKDDIFRIGVATSSSPTGPFKAQPSPIKNSFSIDPCVFQDTDGSSYLYFGGIWGGQLQRWSTGQYDPNMNGKDLGKDDLPALSPKIAKLNGDMLEFSEKPKDVMILDENGQPLLTKDHTRRFFEAAWVYRYQNKYYFTYSTGDTHQLCYAIGTSPYGPFTYKGLIMKPVLGWTTHESIVEYHGKWYLFYHDTELSGKSWLRNVKVTELHYRVDGTIVPIDPQASEDKR